MPSNKNSNNLVVPEAQQGLNQLKMEVANEVGIANYDSII
ncbi:small, acid-soluble spore protein, alpha/beta type [Clostridium botulinum]|nr:small, acid-soluble spore protein, alpha/beta type [Clostridium botulinum]